MATITLADLLDATQDADCNQAVYVDVGGRYVNVSDVQVEGHKIIITLSEDDL